MGQLTIYKMVNIVLFYVNWLYMGQKKYRLLFNNVIKPRQCYSYSDNHGTTPISIMFSRFGLNENCVKFVIIILYPSFKTAEKF